MAGGVNAMNFLAEKLGSALTEKLKEEVSLVVTFKEEFESIYNKVAHIKSMLNNEQANSESMIIWLQKLRDVLNDAMDLVEECEEADKNAVQYVNSNCQRRIFNHPMGWKLIRLHQKCRNIIFTVKKGHEIRDLKERIEKINGTGTYLKSFVDVNPSSEVEERRTGSSLLLKNDRIVGIQDDISVITKKLLEEDSPRVIAVWGMGGLGKTTLARHVFDSKEIQNGFKHRVWLSVSEKFKIGHLLLDIADQIKLPELTSQHMLTEVSMDILRARIRRYIQGEVAEPVFVRLTSRINRYLKKPFLFVLDDVWDKNILSQIGLDLENKNNKIKILLTTRDKGVSNDMAAHHYTMKYLLDEESLNLFCIHAFPSGELPEHLDCFRADIVEKCTRLPMAVEAIAQSMAGVSMIDSQWEMALRALDRTAIINKHVIPTLRSSYNSLPQHLKACFHYFASFPPNTQIKTDDLVYSWLVIFREFLPARGVDAFDVAWSYVDQLIDRCVIEASELGVDGRVKYCQMQDFFHGLALLESHKEANCFLMSGKEFTDFPAHECKDARRIALAKTHISIINNTIHCPKLRILSLSDNTRLTSISASFFLKMKHLAVLDLSKTGIKILPSSIGNLKRVKFLNLSQTHIESLPESLSGLRSLMFLDVSDCEDLRRLHSGIGEHTLMKYLNASGCKKLESLPSGISKLRSLQLLRLKGVVFNRKAAANYFGWTGFNDLTDMKHLSVTFSGETSLSEGFLSLQSWPRMGKMRVLLLQYLPSGDECCTLPPGLGVMERLERLHLQKLLVSPPASPFWEHHLQNLKELTLEGDDSYGGSYYKGIEKIPNLKKLRLVSNKRCVNFPKIFGESKVFPKLEKFNIEHFKKLEMFPALEDDAMPSLKHLVIKNCSLMKEIPTGLDKLKSLEKLQLDPALLKPRNYPQIKNATGITIKYVLKREGYQKFVNASGKAINYIEFEETDEPPSGSSQSGY